jgi:hypothetical protein
MRTYYQITTIEDKANTVLSRKMTGIKISDNRPATSFSKKGKNLVIKEYFASYNMARYYCNKFTLVD